MEDGEKQKKHNDERQDEILKDSGNRGVCRVGGLGGLGGVDRREKRSSNFKQKESIQNMPKSSEDEPEGRVLDTEDFKEIKIKQSIEQGGIRGI